MGILFFPMGLMKGGLPSLRKAGLGGPAPHAVGQVPPPVPISNGGVFALGILLVILGIDAVLVPGYLVFKSDPMAAGGVLLTLLGLVAIYFGLKKPSED
jgi:hypothetical protein